MRRAGSRPFGFGFRFSLRAWPDEAPDLRAASLAHSRVGLSGCPAPVDSPRWTRDRAGAGAKSARFRRGPKPGGFRRGQPQARQIQRQAGLPVRSAPRPALLSARASPNAGHARTCSALVLLASLPSSIRPVSTPSNSLRPLQPSHPAPHSGPRPTNGRVTPTHPRPRAAPAPAWPAKTPPTWDRLPLPQPHLTPKYPAPPPPGAPSPPRVPSPHGATRAGPCG